eukprot:9472637-Pyramimonas_sp.AAC.1
MGPAAQRRAQPALYCCGVLGAGAGPLPRARQLGLHRRGHLENASWGVASDARHVALGGQE